MAPLLKASLAMREGRILLARLGQAARTDRPVQSLPACCLLAPCLLPSVAVRR